jgi:peptidoglycan/LPS O-acetylase OafA/YrhL
MLRFFAALWVVFAHQHIFWKWIQAPLLEPVRRVLDRGDCAVKLFFVLSGFILTHVYARKATFSRKSFYRARFARIYPLYAASLALALPCLVFFEIPREIHGHGQIHGFLFAGLKAASVLLLLQSWVPSFAPFWNPVAWSLSAEAFFYLLFPKLIRHLRERSTGSLLGVGLACLVVEAVRWHFFSELYTRSADKVQTAFWVFTPILRLPDFVTGILLGVLWQRGIRLQPRHSFAALALVVLGCMATPLETFQIACLHLGTAGLISSLAFSGSPSSRWVRAGVLLGRSSYALYLIHEPVSYWFAVLSARIVGFQPPYPVYLGFVVFLSVLAFTWVETPARNLLREGSA